MSQEVALVSISVVLELYGALILAIGGLILPMITIAISSFPEGTKKLKDNYESEKKQASDNLKRELDKIKDKPLDKELDLKSLNATIRSLKNTERQAQNRLMYLSPHKILTGSLAYLALALIFFIISVLFLQTQIVFTLSALVSILALLKVFNSIINSVKTIIEASVAVQEIQKSKDEKMLELLTIIADNSKDDDASMFVESKAVKISFKGEELTGNNELTFSANKKHKVAITLENKSDFMLKTFELGFTFPSEFLVDKTGNIASILPHNNQVIVRYKHEFIQSKVKFLEGDMEITFLKVGEFKVDAFIKGENLKFKSIDFKIKVIE